MDPTSLPDYKLFDTIGGGPLTRVVAGRHRSGEFDCVVKLLRPEWASDPVARAMIRSEAKVGLGVRHPHLVRILDAHIHAPPYFVVMEKLRGHTPSPFSKSNVDLVAMPIGKALSAIHRAGFVHADVKPSNIMIDDAGHATLIDFGFAHSPGQFAELLNEGYQPGTPEFMAPELREFRSGPTFASDWYAFGRTLQELSFGRRVPTRLCNLIGELLAPSPLDRPTGTEVLDALMQQKHVGRWAA